jgi:cyclophilin family peptidyl-prolyl cis-trans isomerase
MWNRIWSGTFCLMREASRVNAQLTIRSRRKPRLEVLEGRQLLTASLGTLSDISVPALLGYQVPLDGSGTTSPTQSFQATSSNPDIKVSVASGPYWTLTVSHQPANPNDITINNETMTFQLFQDLTPNTVSRITTLTNDGFFTAGLPNTSPTGPGHFIPRITSVSSSGFSAIQGGSSSSTSTASSSGLTPTIATEIAQQLAFTGSNQLAMANTGSPNSSDAQFFITNGVPSTSIQQAFDFNFSIFGQLVSGQQTVTDLSKVAVTANSSGENSQPITPVITTNVALSSQNPNGVLHVDTSSAKVGETATITVTATDPADQSRVTRTFNVTVGAYTGPTNPITAATPVNTPTTIQLKNNPPTTIANFSFSFQLVTQPSHGTASLNSSTGAVVYTPNSGYRGPDTFQYQVLAQAPNSTSTTVISSSPVQVTVGAMQTGAVRLLDNILIVTPVPRAVRKTNNIQITQVPDATTGNETIQVTVNGIPDSIQPVASSLDRLVVFGGKASDNITVDSSVTVPATLDGGHGGKNIVIGGGGTTAEHGWFGRTLLTGGTGSNKLIGRKGLVRFKPSRTSTLIYAGNANPSLSNHRPIPPGGTFYRFVRGRLVRV